MRNRQVPGPHKEKPAGREPAAFVCAAIKHAQTLRTGETLTRAVKPFARSEVQSLQACFAGRAPRAQAFTQYSGLETGGRAVLRAVQRGAALWSTAARAYPRANLRAARSRAAAIEQSKKPITDPIKGTSAANARSLLLSNRRRRVNHYHASPLTPATRSIL
jgi:hypothetical protein